MAVKNGICSTRRHYKRDKLGSFCEQNVSGRTRGPNQEPCGWWKKRRAVKR